MPKRRKRSITLFKVTLLICSLQVLGGHTIIYAQSDLTLQFTTLASGGDELPFWFYQQQYGIVDKSSGNVLTDLNYSTVFYTKGMFSISGNSQLLARASSHSTVTINKLNVRASLSKFLLNIGRFDDPLGESYSSLSTGNMMISRNTTPIPRVAVYTDGYVDIPGTYQIVSFKSMLAHGWFGKNRFTNNAYLHQKYFYLRLSYDWLSAFGGIIHNVQWSGVNKNLGKLPGDFNAFIEAAFALGSSSSTAPSAEQSNAVGNSVAGYDFGLEFRFDKYRIDIQRMFYLEDKISTRFRSFPDGLWNLRIRPSKGPVREILYEHIQTKRQDKFSFEPFGVASYYNHYAYRTGWTYQGQVLGNSLILTNGGLDRPIVNNILVAHHLGGIFDFKEGITARLKYTYSRNYGEVQDQIIEKYSDGGVLVAKLRPLGELKKINHSIYLKISKELKQINGLVIGIQMAGDTSELYGRNWGLGVSAMYSLDP